MPLATAFAVFAVPVLTTLAATVLLILALQRP